MGDGRETYSQQIEAARLALSRGDRPSAAESFRAAVAAARGDAALERELASALIQLGKLEHELGQPADAQRLLHEALGIGERLHGAEHPSLGVVLNELGRLHIRQSNHARAKVVLERLLEITRSQGEDGPDVATALAGLGMVHRGLGDDAAAESLYREALRIREKVLAPNHMAIVVTMEQLSETCAARGDVGEALALLRRALPRRVAAVGGDHATVRAVRSRMTALEARAAAEGDTASQPDLLRQPEAAASSHAPLPDVHALAPSWQRAEEPAAAIAPAHPPTANRRSARKRRAAYAAAGLATAALVIAAVAFRAHADGALDGDAATSEAERRATHTSADAGFMVASTGADSLGSTATLQLLARRANSEMRAAARDSLPATPSLPAAPKRLAAVTVPVLATNVDSLLRASTKTGRESYTDRFVSAGALKTPLIGGDASGTPPVLIGQAPLPYFPDALRSQRTEGEVVVRFRVDERGLVDASSMKVMKSDHELFTLAVRNVLPRFRFEPARSPAPESKARAEWVDFRAEFTARN